MTDKGKSRKDYISNLIFHAVGRAILKLPYHKRVPFMGWIVARIIAPLSGYRTRISNHLAYTCPELGADQVKRISYESPNNMGRYLIELYSGDDFISRVRDTPVLGEGAKALAEAHKAGRPVVLITGHFGNYDVPRTALIALGYKIGAVYMPMKNQYFNAHYESVMGHMGGQLFAYGRKGMAQMVKYLRAGGMVCFVADRYVQNGAELTFFNKKALTALSAANIALKYDALLVPIYGIRDENGLDFTIQVDAPIPHTDAETMTQALNDGLEQLVRQHMGQWSWFHRRWRPEPQRTLAAAKIDP